MPIFTNDSGRDLDIPSLGLLVLNGETFTVSEEAAVGLRDQSNFVEGDPATGSKPAKVRPATVSEDGATDPAADVTVGDTTTTTALPTQEMN